MQYNATEGLLHFEAEVPFDTWFAVGFGSTMKNSDMILIQSDSRGRKNFVTDLYSYDNRTPTIDNTDNLLNVNIT